jgi:pyrimidine-specific ribonucleoside hydrolase
MESLDNDAADATQDFDNDQRMLAAPSSTLPASRNCSANCAVAGSVTAEKSHAARTSDVLPYIFDMETGDPDDVLTLLFLCSNPSVQLRAVTITPGSNEQVSLVRWILNEVGVTGVHIGAQDWPANASKKGCMSGKFYDYFGRLAHGEPACKPADRVLFECCDERVTLVTGAALHNLGAALDLDGFGLGRWVAQGGFAGDGVVPRQLQMDKFAGKVTCPTYNFNGNADAAIAALASPCIGRRLLVSKNVCHRAVYDAQWHAALGSAVAAERDADRKDRVSSKRFASLSLMHGAMSAYLRRNGDKKLHDPLALAVALDESVCQFAEVEVFRSKGGWGSRLAPGTNVWISIDYDPLKFQSVLLCDGLA